MYARVVKPFTHGNTGIAWAPGQAFDGTEAQACELARRGYVEFVPGEPPGTPPAPPAGAAEEAAPEAEAPSAGAGPGPDAAAPTADDLQAMTVPQLVALCAENGIETPSKPRKDALVAALSIFYAGDGGEGGE